MKVPDSSNDVWDKFYSDTHGGTNKAVWELDDDEIPEHEIMVDEYED